MKFSLIAALVVFALAQGSLAQDITDLEKLGQYFENMKNKMTQELNEMISTQDLASQAQTFMEDQKAKLEPMLAQIQQQLRTVSANIEQQVKPMAADVQAQVPPMVENLQKYMETLIQQLTEKTKAIGN